MNEFHLGRLLDHVHIRVADVEESKRFYRAVLRGVGRDLTWEGDGAFAADELFVSDDGPPGERKYHAGYYAAYVLDPDGNNVEAVFHGPATRSSPSIVVRPASESG